MRNKRVRVSMLKEYINDRKQAKHYSKMIKKTTIYKQFNQLINNGNQESKKTE